jgi:hypothetical protein
MGSKSNNPTAQENRLNAFATAASSPPIKSKTEIVLDEETYTPQQISTLFKGGAGACAKVRQTKSDHEQAIVDRKAEMAKVKPIADKFEAWVKVTFGGNTAVLAACGITKKPRAKPSAQTTADAVKKRAAKRQAKEDATAGSAGGTAATSTK